ncbi:hypothetical protein CEXT_608211 [Caerostris extrusa]|uniref:Uncharacterized protein n=1 Tax=Caerostris extrusa TaxID=172846 RepID=A0AAV4U2G3_CAEEX|nr:hypothetical protein CEXT_608211 [Caerostris extrusa]
MCPQYIFLYNPWYYFCPSNKIRVHPRTRTNALLGFNVLEEVLQEFVQLHVGGGRSQPLSKIHLRSESAKTEQRETEDTAEEITDEFSCYRLSVC